MTDKYYYEYDEVDKVWSVYETFPEGRFYDDYDVHCFDCVTEADAKVAVKTFNDYVELIHG